MDVREKLIEICFREFCDLAGDSPCGCDGCPYKKYSSENGECYEEYKKDKFVKIEKTGVTVQEWIPVNDRLPEMGEHYQSEDVLVCIDYRPDDPDTTKDSYVSIDHVDFNCFGQGWFSCERDDPRDGEPSPYFVTHWMPMPAPPKGE